MTAEKTACCFSNYPVEYCKYEDIPVKVTRDPLASMSKYIPVGSVEFTESYAVSVGMSLPYSITYPDLSTKYLDRCVKRVRFADAENSNFVKPYGKVKLFTGDVKKNLIERGESIDPDAEVWMSEVVPFESEFRFYIHDFVTGPKVQGWSRYDDLDVTNPEPDISLVETIARDLHESLGPNAYSIDIGWRPDLNRYCLVEVNDGWSLGYYTSSDHQSNPPTRQQYADMMVSRWTQIVFCNLPL